MSNVERKLDRVAQAIKDKPVSSVHLDKDGVWQVIQHGSTTTKWIHDNYLS